jgi:hypothetical protein
MIALNEFCALADRTAGCICVDLRHAHAAGERTERKPCMQLLKPAESRDSKRQPQRTCINIARRRSRRLSSSRSSPSATEREAVQQEITVKQPDNQTTRHPENKTSRKQDIQKTRHPENKTSRQQDVQTTRQPGGQPDHQTTGQITR